MGRDRGTTGVRAGARRPRRAPLWICDECRAEICAATRVIFAESRARRGTREPVNASVEPGTAHAGTGPACSPSVPALLRGLRSGRVRECSERPQARAAHLVHKGYE
jgi:hypothetical protein